MSEVNQDLPLQLLGSTGFFPALVAYIRSLSNSSPLPLDQVIVKSLLLCLIAGDKHLILRTPEEDVGLVVKLVAWTLSTVFSFSTHRVKIRSWCSPRLLPQLLFLPKAGAHGRLSRTGNKAFLTPKYSRSVSYPNDLSNAHSRPPDISGPEADTPNTLTPRLLHHSYTEPPLPRTKPDGLELPRGLVLSGVEKASAGVHRELSTVISDRQITLEGDGGIHKFPPGFLTVYVCSINGRERPALHKSLLDKFSMSHNVFISQSIRHAFGSLPYSPLYSFSQSPSFSYSNPGSPSISFQPPLPQTQTQTPPYFAKPLPPVQPTRHLSISNPPAVFAEEPIPQTFIDTLQKHCHNTNLAPELGLYLSDLFSAARHHPCLDGMLLTAKARKDAEDLARAARVVGSDLTGMELVRPVPTADDVSEYFDAQSARRPRTLDESSTTNLIRKDSVYGSVSRVSSMGLDDEDEIAVLDVTEVDVARTMPRVVSHRLSLRGGPDEEVLASAVVGATFGDTFRAAQVGDAQASAGRTETVKGYGSLTVKDVLVDILNKV